MLDRRPLGSSGLLVSQIGFGGAAIGIDGYLVNERRSDEVIMNRAKDALMTALDEGISLFDTAPGYGLGLSERIFGATLAPYRPRIVLSTKVKVEPGQGPADWTRSVAASLERLQTDYVDLLQLHGLAWSDDRADWVLREKVIDWLESMRSCGWTRAIGLTAEVPSGGLERLIDTRRFDVLQMAFSVIYQGACDYQRAPFGPIPRAKALGMGVITMRAATSGVLQKLIHSEFPELDPNRITKLALRFVLSTPEVDSALIGMRLSSEVKVNAALCRDGAARIDIRKLHDFFDGRSRNVEVRADR